MINLENYEIYIIDYLDGKLSSTEVDKLLAFLDLHPSIKDDFYAISHANFQEIDKSEIYPNKELLKKNYCGEINKKNISEYLIGKIENNLGAAKEKELDNYILFFPEVKNELDFFEKTKLKAELSIKFPLKESLYRKEISLYFYFNRIAIAAIIILAIGFAFNLYNRENYKVNNAQLALTKPINKIKENQILTAVENSTSPLSNLKKSSVKENNKSPINHQSQIEVITRAERQNLSKLKSQIANNIESQINNIELAQRSVYLSNPDSKKYNKLEIIEKQNNYLSPKELLFAKIKNIAKKSIQTNSTKENEIELSGSDLAALLITGINGIAGTEIKIIDNEDSRGIALGNNESYEVSRGK